jgi:hypothetical protein
VALALFVLVLTLVFDLLHRLLFARGELSVLGLTDTTVLEISVQPGLVQISRRLSESKEVLWPLPGASANEVVFREINNQVARIRLDPVRRQVLSEVQRGDSWMSDSGQPQDRTGRRAVAIPSSEAVIFTAQTPTCVLMNLTAAEAQRSREFQVTFAVDNESVH